MGFMICYGRVARRYRGSVNRWPVRYSALAHAHVQGVDARFFPMSLCGNGLLCTIDSFR